MKLQRMFSCITGVCIAVGFAASQSMAGTGPQECNLAIEINALRGGSPTVTVNATKDITSKARIEKGSAVDGTTIDTQLMIEAIDGTQTIDTKFAGPIRLGIGKGGQGDKLRMVIGQCLTGEIEFKATFSGVDLNNNQCTAERSIFKTCK